MNTDFMILTVLFVVGFILTVWFWRSADKDARGWSTMYDYLAHPYSTATKVLCIVWLLYLMCAAIGASVLVEP